MAARKTFILIVLSLLTLVGGAASPQYIGEAVTQLKPASFSGLQSYLRDRKPDVQTPRH